MKIRTKVTLSSLFFVAVSSGVGAWCFLNIQKEENAFAESRRAAKTLAVVSDIEYFLTRQGRALQNYILLNDEAEKLQFQQAESNLKNRMTAWKKAAENGEARGEEIPNVQKAYDLLAAPARKINGFMDEGKKVPAMGLVDSEFAPASKKSQTLFKEVKTRVEAGAQEAEVQMLKQVRENHWALMAGLGLVVFFGLVFLISFYRSVSRPIRMMREWADRIAQGEKNVPWEFTGRNELTDLAASLGEMAIQLTRPRAVPAPATPVPPPAPTVVLAPSAPAKDPRPEPAAVLPAPTTPAPAAPVVSPPAPPRQDEFEDAVEGFREILAGMAGESKSKNRKIG